MKVTKEKQPAECAALPAAALRDEHAGRGGSYIYDPATSARTRVADKQVETKAEVAVHE
jgi:hypothetical protein